MFGSDGQAKPGLTHFADVRARDAPVSSPHPSPVIPAGAAATILTHQGGI